MKFKNTIMLVILLITIFVFMYGAINYGQGNIIHTIPPVIGEMYIIGDNIYFLHDMGILGKHSKGDLSEVDTLEIHKCLNITYSSYLDRIIAHADFDPSYIVIIDYEQMEVESETEFYRGRIAGICCSGDKLYIVIDNSGIPLGGHYTPGCLPNNTGLLAEVDLDDMSTNWEVHIGTLPNFVVDAGDYVAAMARETMEDSELDTWGSIVSVVDKSTKEVRQVVGGPADHPHMEYDGENRIYISNPNAIYEYSSGKDAGLSILHLDTWEIEHIVLDKDPGDKTFWKAQGTYLEGSDLYISYLNSKYNGNTYFGKYDIITGQFENIELPGISQFLIFIEKDGSNLYFSTMDGWLIKYTME